MVKVELELSSKEYTELINAVYHQIRNYEGLVDGMKKYNQKYDDSYCVKEIAQYEEYISMLNSIHERVLHSRYV